MSDSPADRQKLVAGYLDTLRTQRQLADNTVTSYGRDLQELLQLAEPAIRNKPLAALTHVHMRKFAAQPACQGPESPFDCAQAVVLARPV